MAPKYDIIVVGGGPAGCTAAMTTARLGPRTLLIDRGPAFGALGSMAQVVDFPGIGDKLTGESVVKRLRWQAREAGAELLDSEIASAALAQSGRLLFCQDGRKLDARAVILATGCGRPATLLTGEAELLGKGVAYSLVRDAALATRRTVAIYGKTLETAEAALHLARIAESVAFIAPTNKLDLPEAVQERIKQEPKVHLHLSTSIKELRGNNGHLHELVLLSGGHEKTLPVHAAFLYHHPVHADATYLAGTVDLGPHGTVLIDDQMATSIPGVFACGDLLCGTPQLPVVAAAQGAMAGLSAWRSVAKA